MADALVELAALADEAGAADLAADARALRARVAERRFFVACVGQFKRGKSTLINALLGEPLLPVGVAPVTSVVTVVRHGARRARVRVAGEDWRAIDPGTLEAYVSEARNPENRLDVRAVEVFCPSPLLEGGLCLVDTPGIGSVFEGNTAETRAFVPQVDAALVVLGGDPPISGDELALVRDVAAHVGEVLYVLGKADRLGDAERAAALAFTREVLRDRLGLDEPEIFEVSALERLEGRGPPRDWARLTGRLAALAARSGDALVRSAERRGFEALRRRLRARLTAQREALARPVEDSERRVAELRACVADARRAVSDLRFRFDAEQHALARDLDERRSRFVRAALPRIAAELDDRLRARPARRGPRLRAFALATAQDVTAPAVHAFRDRERPAVERDFAAVTERLVAHANGFLAALGDAGRLPPDALPAPLDPETGLRARGRYHFTSFMALTTPSPWRWVADWLTPRARLEASVREAALGFARRLLEANANRVVGDFDERITESRRSIEAALHRRLDEVVRLAEEAAARAAEVRSLGERAVAAELAAIDDRLRRLDAFDGTLDGAVDGAVDGGTDGAVDHATGRAGAVGDPG
jgi:hypothetical protein